MKGVIKMIKITLKDGSIKEVENGFFSFRCC